MQYSFTPESNQHSFMAHINNENMTVAAVVIRFNILLNTPYRSFMISEQIFLDDHLSGAKTQSSQQTDCLVLATKCNRNRVTSHKPTQQLQENYKNTQN